ncbi:sensor histidine kinase [Streptomyces sp. DSM 110735]|uniref:sensor histidine kinase n=1 Tax=Streptomyces sp. DSM 110735 TaxID=2775031 RepID=UPI0018F2E9AC|nr:histidine kinase [Streptomyces sp. DSM 110735]MBJ7902422.1 sensor histidine kinase [Streptomyces sp. DSM 110735]
MTTSRGASGREARGGAVAVGVCCLVLGLAILLAVPPVAHVPGSSAAVPAVGSAAWCAILATVAAQSAAVAVSTRKPRTAAAVVVLAALLLAGVAPGDLVSVTAVPEIAAVGLVALTTGHRLRSGTAAALFAGVVVATAVNAVRSGAAGPLVALALGVGQGLIVVGVPLLIALVVVGRREVDAAHRREIAALTGEREALVASAIAAERVALARDLHDIAAHHLSGIAVLAAAMERQIEDRPAAARESAHDIRAQSMAVLGDLRKMVGLLRDDDMAPLAERSLRAIPDLFGPRQRDGHRIDLTVQPDGADPGVGVSALAQVVGYHMVQEALANASLHAPGARCSVTLDGTGDDRVAITVRNDRAPGPVPASGRAGFGLIGMRERAALVGASVDYGPTPGGGWQVTLELPRERPSGHRRLREGVKP